MSRWEALGEERLTQFSLEDEADDFNPRVWWVAIGLMIGAFLTLVGYRFWEAYTWTGR